MMQVLDVKCLSAVLKGHFTTILRYDNNGDGFVICRSCQASLGVCFSLKANFKKE
jgi:hypothetical protein